MSHSTQFDCDRCGTCCRTVDCEHLKEDNTCAIYETRPDRCRVDKLYEILTKRGIKESLENFYIKYKEKCELLRRKAYAKASD